jgi:hypothetical protein
MAIQCLYIPNKDEKIMQTYQLLDEDRIPRIKDTAKLYERSSIKKLWITANNSRYTQVQEEYYGKLVYAVTFPLEDGRPETEFIVLVNLDLNRIVGYGVLE